MRMAAGVRQVQRVSLHFNPDISKVRVMPLLSLTSLSNSKITPGADQDGVAGQGTRQGSAGMRAAASPPADVNVHLSSRAVELARQSEHLGQPVVKQNRGDAQSKTDVADALQKLKARAGQEGTGSKYAYIEESGLPDPIQHLLKKIRDIKERMRELQAQINRIRNNNTLAEKTKRTRLVKAETEHAIFTAALVKTTDTLRQMLFDMKAAKIMSEDAVKLAGQLAAI